MADIYAYTSNNIHCNYTMSLARSGNTVTLTVSGTIYGNGSSSDSTSGQALYVQVRTGVSPTNTSGTTTYVSSYGTLLSWTSTTSVTGYTGTNSNCMIASNTTSNNLPPLNATGFPTGGRAFTVTYTTTNGAAVSLSDVALFIFKSQTATTAPSNGAYTFIGKKSSSLSGNQIRYVTQDLSVAAATYTVSYNKGANGTGTNTTDTKTYGVTLTLKGATFTRAGYYQSGWATSDGGAQAYALSASYTANAAVTLYPVWTAYKVTIKFHANGGTLTTGTGETRYRISSNILQRSTDSGATWSDFVSTISQGTDYVNLINITASAYDGGAKKTGYHIVGTSAYRVGNATTGTLINQDTTSASDTNAATIQNLTGSATLTSNVTVTLYTNWIIDTYTISYSANGHGTAPSSQTKTYNVALTLQSFISNVNGTESTVTITGDNSNGDSWSGSNGSAKWRPVYSQTYWNTNSSGTGTNYSSGGSYTANAAATLHAIWATTNTGTSYTLPTGTPVKNNTTSSSMTVTFNPNGGSTTKSSQGSVKTTTYTFKGWFTAASGGTQRTTSSRVTAAETVYSQFTGTTGAQAAVTLPTAAQCTRQGYTLLGWSTSDTATTASYAPGASYTPAASIILYAVWKANTYTYVYSDGEWKLAPVYIYQGGSWKEISTVIKIYNGTKWTEV